MAGNTQDDVVGGQRFDKTRNTPEGRAETFAAALAPALAAALNPILSSRSAADREMKNAADSLRLLLDQQRRSLAVTETMAREMSGVQAAASSFTPGSAPYVAPFPSRRPLDAGYGDRSATSTWLPEGRNPVPGPPEPGVPSPFREGQDLSQQMSNYDRFARGRGYSIGQLRTDVGRSLGHTISGASFGPPLQASSTGQMMEIDPATGQVVGQATRGQIARYNVANTLRSTAGGIAEQGVAKGIINSLPQGFGRTLGIAGAAWAIGNQGLDFAEKQRSDNLFYQQVSGGSNLSGFGARAEQGLFRLSQRGVMGGTEADQLYRGVYAETQDNAVRQDYLEFGADNYRRFGMAVSESLSLIATAAKAGNEGLVGVADALDEVTTSAKEAGRNAAEARQLFEQSYATTSGILTGETTATGVSQAVTSATTELGRSFNVDTSRMFGEQSLRYLAAQAHVPYSRYLAANTGPIGGGTIVADQDRALLEAARNLLTPRGLAIIEQYRAEHNIVGEFSEADRREAARLIQLSVNIDPATVIATVSRFEIGVPEQNDAIPFLVGIVTGSFSLSKAYAPTLEKYQAQKVGSGGMTSEQVASNLGVNLVSGANGQGTFIRTGSSVAPHFTSLEDIGKSGTASAAEVYAKRSIETQSYFGIVEDLIKNKDLAGQKFNVGGKEMTLAEALQANPEAFERGTATFASGANKGRSVSEVVLGTSSGGSGGQNELRIWFDSSGMRAAFNGTELTSGAPSTFTLGNGLPTGNG